MKWLLCRFHQVLVSNVSKLCYRSKHKLAEKLLEETDTYGAASILDRSKFLDKVLWWFCFTVACLVQAEDAGFVKCIAVYAVIIFLQRQF